MHPADEDLQASRLADREATASEGGRGVAQRLAFAHFGYALRTATPGREAIEQLDRVVAGDAVRGKAGVVLKLRERAHRRRPEDAVDAAGVEAQHAEPALQLRDVVTALHRSAEIEETVAEPEAGLDDRAPCLLIADTVGVEPAGHLERAHGGLGGRAEHAVLGLTRVEPCRRQTALQIAHGLTRRASAQREAVYRNSPSSWRSWPLPLAPTSRFFACPSLNTIRVGMLMTSIAPRDVGVVVDVELDDLQLVLVLGGDLLEDRRDHLAGPAPLCPEVDHDRFGRALHDLVERGVGQRGDLSGHRIPLGDWGSGGGRRSG